MICRPLLRSEAHRSPRVFLPHAPKQLEELLVCLHSCWSRWPVRTYSRPCLCMLCESHSSGFLMASMLSWHEWLSQGEFSRGPGREVLDDSFIM